MPTATVTEHYLAPPLNGAIRYKATFACPDGDRFVQYLDSESGPDSVSESALLYASSNDPVLSLVGIETKPELKCSRCLRCWHAINVCIGGKGSDHPDILIVGEAPGREEDSQGIPFVGRSGKLLDQLLLDAGIQPERVRITNTFRCVPWKDEKMSTVEPPRPQEQQACTVHFEEEVAQVKPKVILALGRSAATALLGKSPKADPTWKGIPVVCTYHPAFLLRTGATPGKPTKHYQTVMTAIKKAASIAKGDSTKEPNSDLKTAIVSNPVELSTWLENVAKQPYPCLAVDTETNGYNPWLDKSGEGPKVLIVSLSDGETGVAVPISHPGMRTDQEALISVLREYLTKLPCVFHNARFDANWLKICCGIDVNLAGDSLIAASILWGDSHSNSLDYLAWRYLNVSDYTADVTKSAKDKDKVGYSHVPLPILARYAGLDALCTYRLHQYQQPLLKEAGQDVIYRDVIAAARVLSRVEISGIPVDLDKLRDIGKEFYQEVETTQQQINNLGSVSRWTLERLIQAVEAKASSCRVRYWPLDILDQLRKCDTPEQAQELLETSTMRILPKQFQEIPWLNVGSSDQLKDFLYGYLGLTVTKTSKGSKNPSTDAAALVLLERDCETQIRKLTKESNRRGADVTQIEKDIDTAKEVITFLGLIRRNKKAKKIISSYIESLPQLVEHQDDKVAFAHTAYLLYGTVTGRAATKDPSIHTMPRSIKPAYVSRWHGKGGLVLSADLSQAELRVLAAESDDPTMVEVYRQNLDLHTETASFMYKVPEVDITKDQRKAAKAVNFGIVYGKGAPGLAETLDITVSEAQRYLDNYFAIYPKVRDWITYQHWHVLHYGFVTSCFGRKRFWEVPDVDVPWLLKVPSSQYEYKIIEKAPAGSMTGRPEIYCASCDRQICDHTIVIQEFIKTGVLAAGYGVRVDSTSIASPMLAKVLRESQNTPIQSAASDISMRGLTTLTELLLERSYQSQPLAWIHDAVVVDVAPGELFPVVELVKQALSSEHKGTVVPVDIEVGARWGQAYDIIGNSMGCIELTGEYDYYEELMSEVLLGYPQAKIDAEMEDESSVYAKLYLDT